MKSLPLEAKGWRAGERSSVISSPSSVSIRTELGIDGGSLGAASRTGNGKLLETTSPWKQGDFVEESEIAGNRGT